MSEGPNDKLSKSKLLTDLAADVARLKKVTLTFSFSPVISFFFFVSD